MAELLGTRALARAMNVSPGAVTKAVKEGRLTPAKIVNGRPLFDLDATRKQWRPLTLTPAIADADDDGGDDNARYRKARADKEEELAAQEKMETGRKKRELVPADEIVGVWAELLRAFSQSLSGIPQKTLSRFPGLTSEGRDFLIEQLRLILDDLSVWEMR